MTFDPDEPRDERGRWTEDDGSAKAGDSFTVFRLGSSTGSLAGKNGGNSFAVAEHLGRVADPEAPQFGSGHGDTVSVYHVTLTKDPTDYQRSVSGEGVTGNSVGRVISKWTTGDKSVSYSFPQEGEGYNSKLLGRVKLSDINERIKANSGYSPAEAGTLDHLQALREATQHLHYSGGVVAQGPDQSNAVKRNWISESKIGSVDDLLAHAPANQKALADAGMKIAAEIDQGTKFVDPGYKTNVARIKQKIDEGRVPAAVTDVVRAGFMVPTPDRADAAIKELGKHFEVADEGWKVTPAGYFDRAAMVHFPDGQIGEVQFWHPDMFEAKEHGGGHKLYEEARSLPNGDPRKAEKFQAMRQIYGGVAGKLPPAWAPVYQAQMS